MVGCGIHLIAVPVKAPWVAEIVTEVEDVVEEEDEEVEEEDEATIVRLLIVDLGTVAGGVDMDALLVAGALAKDAGVGVRVRVRARGGSG